MRPSVNTSQVPTAMPVCGAASRGALPGRSTGLGVAAARSTLAAATRATRQAIRMETAEDRIRPLAVLCFITALLVSVAERYPSPLLGDDAHDLEVQELRLKLHRARDRLAAERRRQRDRRRRRACHRLASSRVREVVRPAGAAVLDRDAVRVVAGERDRE